ncbi:MAG: type III-A CRISPR-associated RAMP protein Csm5 [bacterium]
MNKLTIEVLTPLHCGTGKYLKGVDIEEAQGNIVVKDVVAFLRDRSFNLEDKIKTIEEGRASDIPQIKYTLQAPLEGPKSIERIREAIKDMGHHPYIPASTVKGAIRTAFFRKKLKENPDILKGIQANTSPTALVSALFGEDDPLSGLKLSDSIPLPQKYLGLFQVKTLTVLKYGAVGWKESEKSNLPEPQKAASIYLEGIKPGESSTVMDITGQVTGIVEVCRAFSSEIIAGEVDFFSKLKLKKDTLTKYNELAELNKALKSNEFLLPIGWGTGWLSKSLGRGIDPYLMETYRYKYHLGKSIPHIEHNVCRIHLCRLKRVSGEEFNHCPLCQRDLAPEETVKRPLLITPFPKTRRLVKEGDKFEPLGWIRGSCSGR